LQLKFLNKKYLFYFFAAFFGGVCFSFSQSQTDSLKKLLKGELNDTARCNVLLTIIENEVDDNVWPEYNEQLLQFAQSRLSSTQKNTSLYFFYLKKIAEALGNIGYLAQVKGEWNRSREFYEKSLRIHRELKNVSGVAISLHNISTIYLSQGNLQLASEFARQSLEIYESIHDTSGLAYVYNALATIADLKGEIGKSFEYYNTSLKLYEKTNDQLGVAQLMNNLANAYYGLGSIEKSLEYHQKSLAIREKIGDIKGKAQSMTGIGNIYLKQEKFTAALASYNKSLALNKLVEDRQGIAYNYYYLAEVYSKQRKWDEAKENYIMSLSINDSINYKMGVAGCLTKIGMIYLKEKSLKKAGEFLQRAMVLSKEIGFPENIRDAAASLSEFYQATNNPKLALDNYKLFIKMRDSLNGVETQKTAERIQAQNEFEKQKAISDKEHEMQINQQKQSAKDEAQRHRLVVLLIGLILVVVSVFSFFLYRRFQFTKQQKKIIELKEKETQFQKLLLEEKHKEITDSINYAKNIQSAFMPNDDIFYRLFENSFLFFKPKDVVSGDFYWFYTKVENNNPASIRHIAVADCTGHGVPGALMSVICSSALNEAVVQKKVQETHHILDEARNIIKRSLKTRKFQERKDGMDIAFITINFDTMELWFSGANNPVWVVQNKLLIELAADKQPVGVHERETNFNQRYLKLNKGDLIYLFSDGLPDQFGGPKGKKFKYKQLSELLLSVAHLPMKDQKEKISFAFDNWKGNLEQVDDVTLVGIRI
jgi:serine phosphatase RsbU (regulator of sigma subunit)